MLSELAVLIALSIQSLSPGGDSYTLSVGGEPWLRTETPRYDASSDATKEATYKVFTHVLDFSGNAPLTKGAGGKYTHHRGLFIGWKDTYVNDTDYDTWHMSNCFQRHVDWLVQGEGEMTSAQAQLIEWCDADGEPFIEERRGIVASHGPEGIRLIDFTSELTSLKGKIRLRGDLQHAGMQIRLANEVSEHEDSTQYILPPGAEELDNDEVKGAWYVTCSAVIRGERYWFIHMTPPDHPGGVPVYSIRRYARFGAFWEPDLEEGVPQTYTFRIVVSKHPVDAARSAELYKDYAVSREQ